MTKQNRFELEYTTRPVTRGGAEEASPPRETCVGHNLKNLGPSQKTLRPAWCPKLVMGLYTTTVQGSIKA